MIPIPFTVLWLIALIVFAVGEAITVGLTSVWFAVGALGALIAAGFGAALWLQVVVFLALSGVTLLLVRPLAKKFLTPRYQATNADRVIGATALVTEEIDNLKGSGLVNISGQVWTARSAHDVVIQPGREVKVLRIEGVKVFVELLLGGEIMDSFLSFLVPIILVVLLVLAANVRVVPQSRAFVIERLGAFQGVWGVGLHFKIPFIERVAKNVSLKEQVVDFPPQPVITKDNVTMQIDTVIYFQITDPKLYTYGVENPMSAIENLTATTLRNIIGDLELDQSLTSRDHINGQMRAILDEATDNWGIKVNRVELKNIMPPRDIQESMEKQMRAERERRESILQAEGQKQSQILVAEGEKQSAILRADAATQAIMKVQQATADAIKLINEANPGDGVLKIKALEAFTAAANGKATKIIVPSEIQGLAGLAAAAKTVFDTEDPKPAAPKTTLPKQ